MQWLINHLLILWLGIVFLGGGTLYLLWMYWVVLRAYDTRWNAAKCEASSPVVDLKQAQRRRTSVPKVGLPLLVIAAGMFFVQLRFNHLSTYAALSIAMFITAPLRKMWGMHISRKVYRRQHPREQLATFWYDVSEYYSWGFEFPEKPDLKPWFEDRLVWLNRLQKLWLVFQLWRCWGFLVEGIVSLLWPAAMPIAALHHTDQVDEYTYWHRPWWRFNRDEQRPMKVVKGTVVQTDPGAEVSTTTNH